MGFGNIIGLYALLSLIPLIILYLRRPKPVDKIIPSLMFFMKQISSSRKHTLFKKLLRNLLFLLQLLALVSLSVSLAAPFIEVPGKASAKETVLVIDISASSQARHGSGTRFEAEIDAAEKAMEGEVSIILAENVPIVVLERGSQHEAKKILSGIEPRDTPSNIGDAMLLASDMLEGKSGKVVVLSDFLYTEGPDPLVAKRALASAGAEVTFVDVSGKASNVGIVDLVLGTSQSKAFVKNFDSKKRSVALEITSSGATNKIEKEVLPESVETFIFDTPQGNSKLELKAEDDFPADNFAFISTPSSKKANVLLVTNKKDSYVQKALEASPQIELTVAVPPVIPSLNYEVIVVHQFSTELIVPGFYKDLRQRVSNGTGLVITAQDDIAKFDKELMPVSISGSGKSSSAAVNVVNQLTKDTEFGMVSKFLEAKSKDALDLVVADDSSPMLAAKDYGDGKVIYYGFLDDYSEFKGTTSYPIFWHNLVGFLTRRENIQDFNYNTGKVQVITEQAVDTPYGTVKTSKLFFDKAGIYSVGDKSFAASLLDSDESDVSAEPKAVSDEKELIIEEPQEERMVSLETFILALALIILLAELIYVKSRGDL